MDEFKVGDTVYCVVYGKGIVKHIDTGYYPVCVEFLNGNSTFIIGYTQEGKYDANGLRTLFFEEIKIPESAYKRPKWRAEKLAHYYYIDTIGKIRHIPEACDEYDNTRFKFGNYFKTHEEAEESKFYKVFHK